MERRQTVRILRVIQRRYLIAVAAAVSLLLAACSSAASTSGGTAAAVATRLALLRVRTSHHQSFIPAGERLGRAVPGTEVGLLRQEWRCRRPDILFTGADTIPALVRGDVDIAAGGPSAGLFNAIGELRVPS